MRIDSGSQHDKNINQPVDHKQKKKVQLKEEALGIIDRIILFLSSIFSRFWGGASNKSPNVSESKSLQGRVSIGRPKPARQKIDKNPDNPQLNIDPRTMILYNKKTGKYLYVEKAPPIENLVISGGGAKGVILPGVMKALEDHMKGGVSVRDQLKNLAGSSIGAVTAGLMAAGLSADKFIEAAAAEDFKGLLGTGVIPINKDGVPLLNFIRKNMKNSISEHLCKMCHVTDPNLIDNVKDLVMRRLKEQDKKYDQQKIEEISQKIVQLLIAIQSEKIDDVQITFSMLHALREIDPKTFKDLTVTAVRRENGKTYYFDAEKTPDLDIAVACRASASLPVILSPVEIDKKLLLPGYPDDSNDPLTFIDGGYLDNIPVGVMHDKQGVENINIRGEKGQNLQTLALIFDTTGRRPENQSPFLDAKTKEHALYNSSRLLDRLLRDMLVKFFAGIATKERNTLTKEKGMEEIRLKYTQRNIPLLVGVHAGDFNAAKKNEVEYRKRGYEQAMEYLNNHSGELIARSFNNFEDLLKYIPRELRESKRREISGFKGATEALHQNRRAKA